MPFSELKYWSKYILILKAREQLGRLESSSYPNMKREEMKKVRSGYYKQAVPIELDESKIHSTKELAIIFKER